MGAHQGRLTSPQATVCISVFSCVRFPYSLPVVCVCVCVYHHNPRILSERSPSHSPGQSSAQRAVEPNIVPVVVLPKTGFAADSGADHRYSRSRSEMLAALVADYGSGMFLAGFAGGCSSRCVPFFVGRPAGRFRCGFVLCFCGSCFTRFTVMDLLENNSVVFRLLRGTLLVTRAFFFFFVQLTGSIVTCVHFLAYWTTSISLSVFAAEMVSPSSWQRTARVSEARRTGQDVGRRQPTKVHRDTNDLTNDVA